MLEDGSLWMDSQFALCYAMEFIMSFLIKLMKIQKTVSNQSLPEDGLNTRNRAGNDSKQQSLHPRHSIQPNKIYSIHHLDLFRPL